MEVTNEFSSDSEAPETAPPNLHRLSSYRNPEAKFARDMITQAAESTEPWVIPLDRDTIHRSSVSSAATFPPSKMPWAEGHAPSITNIWANCKVPFQFNALTVAKKVPNCMMDPAQHTTGQCFDLRLRHPKMLVRVSQKDGTFRLMGGGYKTRPDVVKGLRRAARKVFVATQAHSRKTIRKRLERARRENISDFKYALKLSLKVGSLTDEELRDTLGREAEVLFNEHGVRLSSDDLRVELARARATKVTDREVEAQMSKAVAQIGPVNITQVSGKAKVPFFVNLLKMDQLHRENASFDKTYQSGVVLTFPNVAGRLTVHRGGDVIAHGFNTFKALWQAFERAYPLIEQCREDEKGGGTKPSKRSK